MDLEFWQRKWRDGQIGFHMAEKHPFLLKYWGQLGLDGRGRVFVPMCGKSNDMVWLRSQGHELLGVELSAVAIESFCELVEGKFVSDQVGVLNRHTGNGYVLLVGDYFALDRNLLGAVAAVYDRGSLVALPPKTRKDYVALQRELLSSGAQILLIAFEYDQSEMAGPPFSIDAYEVNELYADWCEVELLESSEAVSALPKEDLDAIECCYRLKVL
ncbi:MAG: thiopurine S-methyltransferase [Proteobacteria bacterium]|jgi:thiopurine S-methyltransferase|nr:thiopurine S-methyltransferase [Pseudomonadota bacterium]